MAFVAIDGDDIGRQITDCFLRNDAARLGRFSSRLSEITRSIATLLSESGFTVIVCAADGVTAYRETVDDAAPLFSELQRISMPDISFSMGVGNTLRESYIALLAAKSNGKNQLIVFETDLSDNERR